MKTIKAFIVDDERLARTEIKRHLAEYSDFEIVGETDNVTDALDKIKLSNPYVIFLDIQMPGKSGFDLLESLDTVPKIIFTTAFDKYAVQAFDVNAIDYLVKPIREERFARAIGKIRSQFSDDGVNQKTTQTNNTIFVKEGERYYFINLPEISLIESAGNYARIYFQDKKVHIKRSLNQLEKVLDASCFFRINRSEIINTNFIKEIKPLLNGRLTVRMQTDKTFTISSRQSTALKNRSVL